MRLFISYLFGPASLLKVPYSEHTVQLASEHYGRVWVAKRKESAFCNLAQRSPLWPPQAINIPCCPVRQIHQDIAVS